MVFSTAGCATVCPSGIIKNPHPWNKQILKCTYTAPWFSSAIVSADLTLITKLPPSHLRLAGSWLDSSDWPNPVNVWPMYPAHLTSLMFTQCECSETVEVLSSYLVSAVQIICFFTDFIYNRMRINSISFYSGRVTVNKLHNISLETNPDDPDVETYTTTVLCYIRTCIKNITTNKRIRVFPNRKPWMTKEVQALLRMWNTAFRSGDRERYSKARHKLKKGIRWAKAAYRGKIEDHFSNREPARMRQGLQHITNYKGNQQPSPDNHPHPAEELNHFFARFETAGSDNGATLQLDAADPPLTPQTHEVRRILCECQEGWRWNSRESDQRLLRPTCRGKIMIIDY